MIYENQPLLFNFDPYYFVLSIGINGHERVAS